MICPNGTVCSGGQCQSVSCPTGQSLCGSRCVDVNSDSQHCGACSARGDPGSGGEPIPALCQPGSCACAGGREECQFGEMAACLDLQNDDRSCGQCGNTCDRGQRCRAGSCEAITCPEGAILCGEQCVVGATCGENCIENNDGRPAAGAHLCAPTSRPTTGTAVIAAMPARAASSAARRSARPSSAHRAGSGAEEPAWIRRPTPGTAAAARLRPRARPGAPARAAARNTVSPAAAPPAVNTSPAPASRAIPTTAGPARTSARATRAAGRASARPSSARPARWPATSSAYPEAPAASAARGTARPAAREPASSRLRTDSKRTLCSLHRRRYAGLRCRGFCCPKGSRPLGLRGPDFLQDGELATR
jgi:hypothetical protein